MTPSDLYTPLHEAAEILRARQENAVLRARVDEYHQAHPPTFMQGGPWGCMLRQVVTGDYEFSRFIALTEEIGLPPLGLSFVEDRFCSKNPDKKCLARLPFWDRHQERILNIVGILQDGPALSAIRCRNGMPLVEFHRRLLEQRHPGFSASIRDFSKWARAVSREHFDYVHFLALFVIHGVLFENFRTDDEDEREFAFGRTIPAFEEVEQLFGVRPLIVRLFSDEEVGDPKWWRYPDELYSVAKAMLREKWEAFQAI